MKIVFDARPEASPLFKEKLLWMLILGLLFFLVYGSTNYISSLTAPHLSFYWEWENSIPFVPELILPYMSSDIVFVVAFFTCTSRQEIQKLGLRYGFAIAFSAIIFLCFPLQFSFIRPSVEGWPTIMFDWLSLDQPYNQLPSLHISLGYLAWKSISARLKGLAYIALTAWFILIALSTVMVFQHHFIDILGGVGVILLIYRVIPEGNRKSWIPLRFVTPRHLHMGFRYLVLTTIFVVLAFNAGKLGFLFGWIALTLFYVTGSYVLGVTNFLYKKRTGYPVLIKLLFWPYLLGCWLNWCFWKRRIPLMAEVQQGIWVGAKPSVSDWPAIQEKGITTALDLVPELSSDVPEGVDWNHFPLLDIAIPDPKTLDYLAEHIETALEKGGVYVHCALGMSRSVLAVCAYLIKQGHSIEYALRKVDLCRPERVTRPYIPISLELYQEYLHSKLK